jgi:octaprenyl-diphosphate synthase
LSTTTSINGKEIFDLLHDDIAAIEDQFGRDTISNVAAITEIGEYLRAGGGKRIRPALLLLSAKLLGYKGDGAVKLASVVEIIHTATLVHDDIIDEAQLRRGRPAANTQWGNSMCVLAGDWLYMQAFKIAVQERNFRILDVLVELTQQLVEGELLQMEKLGKLISLHEHLDLIYRKTACLFSVCMRVGGILGGANATQEERLAQYGRDLGIAFQIVDDVLDLTASESVLGKPVASDLREGKVTMAVIHALEQLHRRRAPPDRNRPARSRLQWRNSRRYSRHPEPLRLSRLRLQRSKPLRRFRPQRHLHFSGFGVQAGPVVGAGIRGRKRKIVRGT